MTDAIAVGQHLVAGFEGTEITEDFRRAVREHKIGNVILFARNVESAGQLRRLCDELQALVRAETGYPAFITIDQEGGMVTRLKADAAVVPGAMAVAATGKTENARLAGQITGRELHALGVNFNLAPVVDVNSNPQNPVIGVRSYGDDPERVAAFGAAMARGLTDGGVLSSLKHFPGHGDTAVDSHVGLPVVDRSLDELMRCELVPFRAGIEAGAPAVMTTHILFPQIEPDGVPATMSRRIITGLLKETLGFKGLVVSDCMMMGAIADHYGTVPGALRALAAGVDLVFTSHSAELAAQVCVEALARLETGALDRTELAASTEKILRYKAAMKPAEENELALVGCKAHREAVARMSLESVTAVDRRSFALGENPLFLGCAPFRASQAANAEDGPASFPEAMRRRFGGAALVTPADPDGEAIAAAVARCAGHSAVAMCTFNGHLHPGQLALARAVAATGLPLCCVAMGNPYDLADLPAATYATYAYNVDALRAIGDVLAGAPATGVLPVRL